jgi:methionine-S-sulfoxide reductase
MLKFFNDDSSVDRAFFIGAIAIAFAVSGCAGITGAAETGTAGIGTADDTHTARVGHRFKNDPEEITASEQSLEVSRVKTPPGLEKAVFAAGCFWGVERILQELPGVKATTVGYTGGKELDTDYNRVCGGKTGHAEAVEVFYDPVQISFQSLLSKFFDLHDAGDKEGLTFHGGQYRSAVFYTSDEQRKIAEDFVQKLESRQNHKIYTQIVPATDFVVAEDFHQNYLKVRGLEASCHK